MNEEEKDSIEILKNTDLDINAIDLVDLHTYNHAVKTVLNLLEKKDKIIDEMAKIIFTVIQGGELPLKILRKHLVRKICDKKFEECFMEDIECEECIKQHFERKIKQ